jgi:hypothetical protein
LIAAGVQPQEDCPVQVRQGMSEPATSQISYSLVKFKYKNIGNCVDAELSTQYLDRNFFELSPVNDHQCGDENGVDK